MKTLNIIIVAICVIVLGLWVFPSYQSLGEKQSTITELKAQKSQLINEQKAVEEKLKIAANQNPETQIPPTREQEILIRDLQQISAQTGFVFKSLSFGKGVNPKIGVEQTTINFSVLGVKEKTTAFLQSIENNDRFLGMESLSVSQVEKNGVTLTQMNVTLYAFSLSD